MPTRLAAALLSLALLTAPGCSSVIHVGVIEDYEAYAGTRWTLDYVGEGEIFYALHWRLVLLDLPATFALDTVLLPFTLPYTLLRHPWPWRTS